jgi:hypothetical protein
MFVQLSVDSLNPSTYLLPTILTAAKLDVRFTRGRGDHSRTAQQTTLFGMLEGPLTAPLQRVRRLSRQLICRVDRKGFHRRTPQ